MCFIFVIRTFVAVRAIRGSSRLVPQFTPWVHLGAPWCTLGSVPLHFSGFQRALRAYPVAISVTKEDTSILGIQTPLAASWDVGSHQSTVEPLGARCSLLDIHSGYYHQWGEVAQIRQQLLLLLSVLGCLRWLYFVVAA